MKQLLKISSVAAAAMLCFNANAVVVDLFNTDQARISDATVGGPEVGSSVGNGDPTILGGNRDIFVSKVSGAVGDEVRLQVLNGNLSFSNDSGVSGTGVVKWDGNNATSAIDFNGLGGTNLTIAGANSFRVDTISSDAGFRFEIAAYTSATQFTIINFSATGNPSTNPPTIVTSYIPFSGFTNVAFCGLAGNPPLPAGVNSITCGSGNTSPVDFASLGALVFTIDPLGQSVDVDLRLDSITAVPEPGSIALVGAALLGLFATQRRRFSAKK